MNAYSSPASSPHKRRSAVGALLSLLLFLAPLAILVYVFLFAARGSAEYDCVLQIVRTDRTVAQALGEPLEPSLIVWRPYFEQEGSVRQASFSFSVRGPRGHGRVEVQFYRSPIGSSLAVWFEDQPIYDAVYPCP